MVGMWEHVDLFHRERAEWLRMDHGDEVRLDDILEMDVVG